MGHQIEQLKEEIAAKDQALVKVPHIYASMHAPHYYLSVNTIHTCKHATHHHYPLPTTTYPSTHPHTSEATYSIATPPPTCVLTLTLSTHHPKPHPPSPPTLSHKSTYPRLLPTPPPFSIHPPYPSTPLIHPPPSPPPLVGTFRGPASRVTERSHARGVEPEEPDIQTQRRARKTTRD